LRNNDPRSEGNYVSIVKPKRLCRVIPGLITLCIGR
jgi:hypothetical protein